MGRALRPLVGRWYVLAMPVDHPTATLQERLAHATSQVAFWQAMSDRIGLDRRNLRYVLPVGLLATALLFVGTHSVGWAAAGIALTVSIWLMGQYFVGVRANEYAYNLQEAHAELARVRSSAATASAGAPLPSLPPVL